MDAFNVAIRVPNLLRDLFAEGAMSAAFVPTFTRRLTHEGRAAAWRLGAQLLNALVVVTGALVLAGILFAEPLARTLADPYATVPGKLGSDGAAHADRPILTLVGAVATRSSPFRRRTRDRRRGGTVPGGGSADITRSSVTKRCNAGEPAARTGPRPA